VRRIRRDGHVRITPCSARGTPLGEAVEADATLDRDTAAVEKLLAQKYGWMYRAYMRFSAVTRKLRREAAPTGVTIRITPR
jgi:PPOX class probable F420-dependent enzyme